MEDFEIFGLENLLFLYTLLRVLRQGISSSINLALSIINLGVVTREFLSLTDLSGAQTLRVQETAKVVMVDEYKYFMLKAF